jgi:hypothetical protein
MRRGWVFALGIEMVGHLLVGVTLSPSLLDPGHCRLFQPDELSQSHPDNVQSLLLELAIFDQLPYLPLKSAQCDDAPSDLLSRDYERMGGIV